MRSVCEIVRLAVIAANVHAVDPVPLVALAIHETGVRDVSGDAGKSKGPWQLNCKVWRQVPCRQRVPLGRQVDFAAWLLKRYMDKRDTITGALQMWNSGSRGYGRRVVERFSAARRLVQRCSR